MNTTQTTQLEATLQEKKPEAQLFTGELAKLQIQPVAQEDLKPLSKFEEKFSTSSLIPKIKTEPLEEFSITELCFSPPDIKPKVERFTGKVQSLSIRPIEITAIMPFRRQKKFNCDLCQKGVGTKGGLIYHMKAHINGRPFKCKICKKSYATKNDFDTHNKRHSGNIFKCDLCSGVFLSKHYLSVHIIARHLPKVGQCQFCKNGRYYSAFSLKAHIRHCNAKAAGLSLRKMYKCKFCGITISSKNFYERHTLKAKESNFKCVTCLQRFSCQKLLVEHKKSERKMNVKCSICKGSFLDIQKHMRTHSSRNLVCEFCKHKSKSKTQFHAHSKKCATQDMLRPRGHHCLECDMYFYSKRSLEIHSSMKHGKLTCPTCPYRSTDKVPYMNHMRRHKKNPIQCLCPKFCMFPNMEAFNIHFNFSHKYLKGNFKKRFYGMCYICILTSDNRKKYKHKFNLEKHMLEIHLKDSIIK